MGYVVLAVAAVIGVLIYLAVCLFVLAYLSTPLALVVAVAGVLAGVVVGLVRALAVLTGRDPRAAVRTPADVATGELWGRVPAGHVRWDRAWPQYYAAQAWLDLGAVVLSAPAPVRWVWVKPNRPLLRAGTVVLWFWPLLLPLPVGTLAFTAGVGAVVLVATAVQGTVAAVAWGVGLLVAGLLRALDRGWQRVFRAGGSCPRCYAVTALPTYRCPGPHSAEDRRRGHDLHRDIRPGRLGVLWRRCGCDTRLPTTVLRAARSLDALCPLCTEPLHKGAAVATDVRIPVFGAASAGKTHLIMAGLVSLAGPAVTPADDFSRRRFAEYVALVESGGSAPKTDVAQQPVALTMQVGNGQRSALVHVFDAAGEALADPEQNSQYAYLDYARTLVFVLDPFSVPAVRDQLRGGFQPLLAEANPARHDPEDSYRSTVSRLRQYGVDTARKRLAFVVTKADLLRRVPPAVGLQPDPADMRAWLHAHGLDNLVIAAERDFAEVRFFLVSARDATGGHGAGEPFRWLLRGERVTVG